MTKNGGGVQIKRTNTLRSTASLSSHKPLFIDVNLCFIGIYCSIYMLCQYLGHIDMERTTL